MNIPSVPASTHNICMYAAFLARSLKPTFKQYVGNIGPLHKELGLENPLTDNYSLFRGIKRVKGDSPVQKLPINIDILLRILKMINFNSGFESSFWAACLIAFYGIFRENRNWGFWCKSHAWVQFRSTPSKSSVLLNYITT